MVLTFQFRARAYVPAIYWLTVTLTSVRFLGGILANINFLSVSKVEVIDDPRVEAPRTGSTHHAGFLDLSTAGDQSGATTRIGDALG